MSHLADAGAGIQDVEQIVVHGRLTLGLVITVPYGRDLLKELLLLGWEHGVQVDFEVVESTDARRKLGHVVTMLTAELKAEQFGGVARAIAESGGNIERIFRVAAFPVTAYELLVSGAEGDELRAGLMAAAQQNQIDVAVQREGLSRRAKRLVVLDVDSTLIEDEVIELLASEAGQADEVASITSQAMTGELDYQAALRDRVRLLKGLDEDAVSRAVAKMTLTRGARTFVRTLKRLGYEIAIISGGFTEFTDALVEELGISYAFANTLEWVDGTLTGELTGPIVDRARKAVLLRQMARQLGITREQIVAVGDGANDLDMLDAAGLGIAFNARQVLEEAADTSLSVPYLDAILFVLGITREEVEEAGES